jgi:CBS domain-containing protein
MHRQPPRGSAATEVGLVMTLVVVGLLIAYAGLGSRAQNLFARLSLRNLASSTNGEGSTNSLGGASVSSARTAASEAEDRSVAAMYLSLGAVLGLLGFGAVLAVRKRKKVVPPSEELPPEQPTIKASELPEALFVKRQDLLHVFENSLYELSGEAAAVDLVMSCRLSQAEPKTAVDDLRKRMKTERLRHVLICDAQGKLLGMVSDRDLAKPGERAEQIMTKSPITVGSKMPLITAVTILINRRFSSLPVVDDGKLVGILTTTDILLAMQATLMLLHRK